MKKHINPIIKKELKIGARSIKMPLAVMFYAFALAFVSYVRLTSVCGNSIWSLNSYSSAIDYNALTRGFDMLSIMQLVIICIVVPILTAGSIAGEREKQTLDIMLTSPISSFQIVWGKLISSLTYVFMFIIASLPALSICFLYGGIAWPQLLWFVLYALVVGFFVGAIGVWSSSMFKRTAVSVIVTMIVEGVFFVLPIIIFTVIAYRKYLAYYAAVSAGATVAGVDLGISPLVLIVDPAVGYMGSVESINSLVNRVVGYADITYAGIINAVLPVWPIIILVVTIIIGFVFIVFAARKLDAPRRTSRSRRVKAYEQTNKEVSEQS